ncbi:MAG: manganese efflux pump MntP family protein [Akkermansia sp.]|nr:manganese efflux pump MntP family protein [Akkermansia sp.]
MGIVQTLAVALALAADATVFAFSYGLTQTRRRFAVSLQLALCTGFFQGVMPLIGYRCGAHVRNWVGTWDHWIVFVTFGWLGVSVIAKAFHQQEDAGECVILGFKGLLMVGVATSIDALAVGVCLALGSFGGQTTAPGLAMAIGTIALVTFLCTLSGFHASRVFRRLPTRWLETAAGLILIALGSRTLWLHLSGGA